MYPFLRSLFLLIALLGAIQASAQNHIFYQKTKSEAFLFKQGGGGPSGALVDYFIKGIAQGANKAEARTEYILALDNNIRLTKLDNTHFDVQVTLSNLRLNGDTRYRGFPLEDILVPAALGFRLEQLDPSGKTKQGWDFGETSLGTDPATIASFRATDSTGSFINDALLVLDQQFIYADANRLAFQERIDLIDEYFQIAPTLEATYKELQLVQPTDLDRLDAQDTEFRRLTAKLDAIRQKNFPLKLALSPQNDPANFLPRFAELEVLAKDLYTRLADTRAQLHIRYHERGLANLQGNRAQQARADFQRSTQLAPKYAPPHVEMARMSYAEGQTSEAVNRLRMIFKDFQPDEVTRQKAIQLAKTIYQNHLGNANYALQQSDFEKALGELGLAKEICSNIPGVPCDTQLEGLYTRAHRGIYSRHVSKGVKAENENRLDEAENEGILAQSYQAKYPAYVTEAKEATALLGRVRKTRLNLMLATAEQSLQAGKADEAEKLTRDAIAYQALNKADLPDPAATQDLLNRVKGRQYLNAIAQGDQAFQASSYGPALEAFEKAKAMEQSYVFPQDSTLSTKIMATAKYVILADSKRSIELAQANRLGEARTLVESLDRMIERYQLGADQEIALRRKEVQDAIFSQECINAQRDFDAILVDAEQHRSGIRYVEATAAWQKALSLAKQNQACGIYTLTTEEALRFYQPAADYQLQVRKADEAITNVNYSGAIDAYTKAGDLFYSHDMNTKYSLKHPSLFDYIKQSGKRDFMLAGADHFIARKEYTSAHELVFDLASNGYPKGKMKATQTRLGQALALRDKPINPTGDPKQIAATYTKGHSAMGTLGKAYIKQWKRK